MAKAQAAFDRSLQILQCPIVQQLDTVILCLAVGQIHYGNRKYWLRVLMKDLFMIIVFLFFDPFFDFKSMKFNQSQLIFEDRRGRRFVVFSIWNK